MTYLDGEEFSLASEAVKGVIAKVLMAATGFIGIVVFARILGPVALGGYYLLFSIVEILDQPVDGWAKASKKRYSEAGFPQSEVVGTQLVVSVSWVIVTAPVVWWFSQTLESRTFEGATLLFVLLLGSRVLFIPLSELLQAQGLLSYTQWIDAARSVLTLGLQLCFVLFGLGAAGMAYGLAGATILVIPILLAKLKATPSLPSRSSIRSLWEYARYSVLEQIVGVAYGRFDVLLLGYLISQAAVGYYEVALKLTILGLFVSQVSGSGLIARISRKDSMGEEIAQDITNTLSFTAVLTVPLFFGSIPLSPEIIVIIFGDSFRPAGPLLIGLALYQLLHSISIPLMQGINGMDLPRINLRVSSLTFVVNIVFGTILAFYYGTIGVVFSTLLAEALRFILLASRIKSLKPKVDIFPRPLLEQLSSGALMSISIFGLLWIQTMNSWLSLLTAISAGGVLYTSILFFISPQHRNLLQGVLEQLGITRFKS